MSRFRYLNGIDWVITGMDRSLRRTTGCGNWSQLVLELNGELDFDTFRSAVQHYASAFPVLQGRAVRGWQLVPGWKIPIFRKQASVAVEKHILPDNFSFDDIIERLGQCVTVGSGAPGRYIGFNLLYTAQKTFLAFRFDHRLMDARGAELFIHGLVSAMQVPEGMIDSEPVSHEKSNLSPWIEKFKSGQKVVRMLRHQQETAAPFQLESSHPSPNDRSFQFTLISLNNAETAALIDRAYDQAGYLMLTPWIASRMSRAVDKLLLKSGRPQLGGHVIPCSIDRRVDVNKELFFNHVSFLYLYCASGKPGKERAKHFSRQFFEQIQSGMPGHLENAWKLARIIPASLFGKLLGGSLKSFAGTCSLASVGNGLSTLQSISGIPVVNAFHMPLVPPAPGLGFFANTFDGKLNFCLTSSSRVLNNDDHIELAVLLKKELFDPS